MKHLNLFNLNVREIKMVVDIQGVLVFYVVVKMWSLDNISSFLALNLDHIKFAFDVFFFSSGIAIDHYHFNCGLLVKKGLKI